MKRRVSLKMRMMITTSLLFVAVGVLFSIFSLFNVYYNILKPYEVMYQNTFGTSVSEEVLVLDIGDFVGANILFLVVMIVLGCALIYLVARFSLKPLTIWSEEMADIDQTQLSKRIQNSNTRDELDKLSNAFNQLLERLQKAFEREKRFSAAAAHELKTPLTVVKANIELLQMDETPALDDYEEAVEVIDKQNERMIRLVDDLMMLSSQKMQEQDDYLDMDVILGEIANDLEAAFAAKSIRFSYNKAGHVRRGNVVLMKHALSNLIQNAVKYNLDGGEVTVVQTVKDKTYTIEVCDTGIGIKDEDVPYIFEPFYRADKSRNRAVGGSGLGLAITKEIIESHNGKIEYRRREPQGSIFVVSFYSAEEAWL